MSSDFKLWRKMYSIQPRTTNVVFSIFGVKVTHSGEEEQICPSMEGWSASMATLQAGVLEAIGMKNTSSCVPRWVRTRGSSNESEETQWKQAALQKLTIGDTRRI